MGVRIPLFSQINPNQILVKKFQLLPLLTKTQSFWLQFLNKCLTTKTSLLQSQQHAKSKRKLRPVLHYNSNRSNYTQAFNSIITLNHIFYEPINQTYKPRLVPSLLYSPQSGNYFNLKTLLNQWQSGLNLIYQLFLYESRGAFLFNPLLSKESLFLNWESLACNLPLFKTFTPFFLQTNTSLSFKSIRVLQNNIKSNVEFAVISDVRYHKANKTLLQRLGVYLIQLHAQSNDPWSADFTILNSSNLILTQYFFIKCCFF